MIFYHFWPQLLMYRSRARSQLLLWRNLIWATFCIKQKCVQIPPYLWCISYIILFLYPLSKSHKKLEVLKHSEEWEQSLDNLKKKSKLSSDTCWTIEPPTFIISHVIFCLCKWMARETTLEWSCNLWMNLGGTIVQHGPSYVPLQYNNCMYSTKIYRHIAHLLLFSNY